MGLNGLQGRVMLGDQRLSSVDHVAELKLAFL